MIRFAFNNDAKVLSEMSGFSEEYFVQFMKDGRILLDDNGYVMYTIIPNGCRIQKIFEKTENSPAPAQLLKRVEEEVIESGDWYIEATIPETDLHSALLFKSLDYIGKLTGNHYLFQKSI